MNNREIRPVALASSILTVYVYSQHSCKFSSHETPQHVCQWEEVRFESQVIVHITVQPLIIIWRLKKLDRLLRRVQHLHSLGLHWQLQVEWFEYTL